MAKASMRDAKDVAIGIRIKEARGKRGLSQHDLALHLGITAGAVGQWETGDTRPTMTNFERMADVLGVSYQWLLTGDNPSETTRAQTKAEEAILFAIRKLNSTQQGDLLRMLLGLTAGDTSKAKGGSRN